MIDSRDEILKHFAIIEEIETSVKLVQLGFGELQNLGQSNDFYFLPFQLLSQGFERTMKSHICLGYLHRRGSYPPHEYLKGLGHDLLKLKNEIMTQYFMLDNRQILADDHELLTNDPELSELLGILSEFGKMARYYNFDVITDSSTPPIDAKAKWVEFENKLRSEIDPHFKKLMNSDISQEVYEEITSHIIKVFEKLMAALSRQFTFGALGDKGKQFSTALFDFALIRDENLGLKDYRKNTTRFKSTPKRVHKRTLLDELNRKLHPEYKSQRILRSEHSGDWPFYADSVVVECRHRHWCVITIEGKDYALNGSAQGKYKLKSPHDAGMAIMGKSVHEFIQIAQKL